MLKRRYETLQRLADLRIVVGYRAARGLSEAERRALAEAEERLILLDGIEAAELVRLALRSNLTVALSPAGLPAAEVPDSLLKRNGSPKRH